MGSGNISALVYKVNFVQQLLGKPIKIWLKNTSETELGLGWSSFPEYTLVFDGIVDFPQGTNLIYIPLLSPFAYSGDNLAVRVNRPMDTEYFNSLNHFFYTDSPDHPNRSRYIQSDTVVYDPALPSAAGTISSNIPFTVFVAQNATLATPEVRIQQVGSDLVLSWNAVAGACNYRIFGSSSPLLLRDTPLAVTNELSYTLPNSTKMFFKVVATTEE